MLELTEWFHAFLFLESVKHVERETRMGGGGREERAIEISCLVLIFPLY